ncbi:hypothetical protein [Pseudomonas putida]|uniref:hypothetical protein n=1 Tax=Pseudomonas putida TaxID=303 RepID=UPI0018A959F3|nr:hypothetical protein [Pseudomonas putida]MBF8660818.1 hypothetical protein [Pseudomonas putida]
MIKVHYEAVQKTNPFDLVVKQHVFPAESIHRFTGSSGTVQVFMKDQAWVRNLAPKNHYFCALRAWDQKSEVGYGRDIESRFQRLADKILARTVRTINFIDKVAIDEFFALCRARLSFKHNPFADVAVKAFHGDTLSIDEQERLEKHHVLFFRNGSMPGRFVAGVQGLRYVDFFVDSNAHNQWGIVRAGEGEFLVPDGFRDMMIVPLSPTISLMADQSDTVINKQKVAVVNRIAIEKSTQYYFARDLSVCPIT